MATNASNGRTKRLSDTERRTLQALREAYRAGQTDAANGGVSAEVLGERTDTQPSTQRDNCRVLVERGHAVVCWGFKPGTKQQRKSWRPSEGGL